LHAILKKLAGGDRRSIGRSDEVVKLVLARPALFRALFQGLSSDDYLVQMRAADAMEKITRERPELLNPYKRKLLAIGASAKEKEFRWHMAAMLPRFDASARERGAAVDILYDYLKDTSSSIVRTFAMQGLADFAQQDPELMKRVTPIIQELTEIGSPAMRARGRILLKQFKSKKK
jgi:hypothetical protein